MNKFTKLLFLGFTFLLLSGYGIAQQSSQITSVVGKLIRVTPKLADIDKTTMYGEPLKITRDRHGIIGISEEGEEKLERVQEKLAKKFTDPLINVYAPNTLTTNTPITSLNQSFDGQSAVNIDPSDNNLAVGPNHVIQMVNHASGSAVKIWNKSGVVVLNATVLSSITGVSGAGDPVVMYDQLADRWVLTEFGPSSCCNSLIIAVSVTADPTGSWKVYQYTDPSFFPDYPKFSVWHNAYYGRTSDFNTAGTAFLGGSIYAFDRTAMIAGAATATMVRVRMLGTQYYDMNTIGLDGTTPSSQNGLFAVPDQANAKINLFEFTPNFTTPASSVVGPLIPVAIAPYSVPPASVAQQGTSALIQTLGQRLMFRLSYRNRGGVESILIGHTVLGASAGLAGARWYEFRRTAGTWGVYQQGTITGSDGNSRFMPGVAMDANGNIAVMYNVSGSTSFPSIKYTARNECDALGQMTLPEQTIVNGTVAHTAASRWGDYNTLAADPNIVGSFWSTAQYGGAAQPSFGSITRVANFTIAGGAATFTSQPTNTTVCAGTIASFTAVAAGNPPLTYQWERSNDGGTTWAAVSGATASTYSFTAVAGDNGAKFRCVATSSCGAGTSVVATLTITTLSQGGTVTASNTNACAGPNSSVLTLSGHLGNIIQWESSTDGGTTWTTIANTTTTYTVTNLTQTTQYRVLVQSSGCTASYSSVATITYIAAGVGPIVITSDVPTTLCAGDPALLTALSSSPGSVSVSSGPITVAIPDNNATGVSTSLTVSGVPASAIGVNASVNFNITHTWDGDLRLFVKSPNNQVLNLVNGRGGSGDNFVNTTISSAATTPIASGAAPFTGTYLPDGSLSALAPTGFTPTATSFAPLYATAGQLNGVWSFAARDNAGGDVGTITSWSLTLDYTSLSNNPGLTYAWSPAAGLNAINTNPVAASPAVSTTYTVLVTNGSGCTSTASISFTVNQRPKVTADPTAASVCANSSATFTVTGTGTGIGYQWQESTNAGVTWTNLSNGTPYAGVNTATLTINPAAAAMNNNLYRCVISGTCSPAANSASAKLTVKALPVVTVTPTAACGGIAGINGTLLTGSGADSYTWGPLAGLYTNATTTTAYTGTATATVYAAPTVFTSYTVTGTNSTTGCSNTATALINYTPPAPTITPSAVAMCLGDPAVRLTSSTAATSVANFTTGTISVAIPDNNITGATSTLAVSGIPANATITGIQAALNITHTWVGDLVISLKAPGGNIVNLDGFLSNTGGAGATSGFTNTRISSAGTAALSSGTNPYNGIFRADAFVGAGTGPTGYDANVSSLLALNASATAANGTWTLAMYDGGPADLGTLTSWGLQITYVVGVPATAATWSPIAGLFTDAAATIAYTGTPTDTVYTRPTPSGVYPYTATVNSLPPAAVKPTTSFANNNGNSTITFNVRNNNAYPVTLSSVSSIVLAAGGTQSSLYAKAGAINGAPGAISVANGWNQVGTTQTVTANGGGAVETLLTGLNLTIAPGQTYGLCFQAVTGAAAANLAYSTIAAGTYTNSAGGVDIITGTNIGYGGVNVPAAPTFTPRGFIGNVGLIPAISGACTSPAKTVVVTVNQPISLNTTLPANTAVCTDKSTTFTVSVIAGTSPTYQWQVSTDAGNTFNNVSGSVYSGATTATLTITAPPVSMSGNIYRCVVSGAAPCTPVNSRNAFLTVNPLPTVVIAASPYQRLFPGLTTTLFSTVTPAASTYSWLKYGVAVPGANAGSLLVNVDGLGDYTLKVQDVNGCINTSNMVSLKDSASGKVFIYPNPNGGQFQVRYYSIINNTNLPRGINVYDSRGKRVLTQKYTITAPYSRMDVNLSNYSTGVYWIEVVDVVGNRLAMGRAEVLR